MIQERSVTVLRGLELFEEGREQRDVEGVDLRDLGNLVRIIPVVRQRVVGLRHASLRVGPRAGFARELEGDDTRNVGLQGQNLQIEHQLCMVGVLHRDSDGPIKIRQFPFRSGLLRILDAPLNLADRIEVFADLGPISGPEFRLQPIGVLFHPIEQTRLPAQRRTSLLRRPALSKQPLKDDPGVGLRW